MRYRQKVDCHNFKELSGKVFFLVIKEIGFDFIFQ